MQAEKQQLVIILLIVFIGFIGSSLAYPIFPPLFLYAAHDSIIPYSWNNDTRSIVLGIALACYPLGQFIGSPILGSCSDRYGRKKVLMISLIASSVAYFISTIALQFNSLSLLLVSRFLTGVMEGNFAIVRAMAADLTTISKYKSIGRMNGIAGIAYVMGPLLGGFLSDSHLVSWFSFSFPFLLATIISILTTILAAKKLTERQPTFIHSTITLWQRFNLLSRFKILFSTNATLKYLLIIGSIFTFAVDIFYEFGPVYLTGLWAMTPADIAVYNAALSITLAIGSGWLPYRLSFHFNFEQIVTLGIFFTAIFFLLMTIWLSPILALILFALLGLSIAMATTNMTIQISNAADPAIQGEAMGAQLGLRMLGDAIICLAGGFIIMSSVVLPIAISSFIALLAAVLYMRNFLKR